MANALVPVISGTIDYQKTPIAEPPVTDFPYPESNSNSRPTSRHRIDSDVTLTEHNDSSNNRSSGNDDNDDPNRLKTRTVGATPVERPTIRLQKYDTEVLRPVGVRPFIGNLDRHSTSGRPTGGPLEAGAKKDHEADENAEAEDDSESLDDTSSESENETMQPSRQEPSRRDLSKGHLNQVQKKPRYGRLSFGNEHFRTKGKVANDGRLNIKLNESGNDGYLAKTLGATIKGYMHPHAKEAASQAEDFKRQFARNKANTTIPRMNIVIMVIGSRGDIQPFLKIGKILQEKYGHRVRIATHPTFKKFVQDEIGLEFFSIGGDPSELMSFMVKNPGLIPSFETVKAGEIGRRREQMFEMFLGFWRACINATDDEKDTANLRMLGDKSPFVADAIIANPPSFAHFHCAEKLGIPLHMVFTFPFTPTTQFPHPLANIKSSNVDREYSNFMSYPLIELMTWQGLGDLVNRFRVKTLGLEPVSTLWAPGQASRLKIPMTYLWSPGLVPKPADWGPEVDIAGYVFLELASSYKPPEDLQNFLKRSDDRALFYIGFGSISGIDDPTAFCKMIFEAVEKANVRAVINRGWGGMGDGLDKPDGVFLLDNVPHDWLFPQVDAVVHHGGAGTTAAGLKFGKPTMIVPFFGDQPFWAQMIAKAGAGAKEALPLKKLDSDKFAEGMRQCLLPEAKKKAEEIAKSIEAEGDGAENAVDSFHRCLQLDGKHTMRCAIFEDRVAVWRVRRTHLKLSALAADLLVESRQLTWADLTLIRHKDWTDFQGPGEPITGLGGVMLASFQEALHGLTSISDMTKKDMKRIEKRKRKGKTIADGITQAGGIAVDSKKRKGPEHGKDLNRAISVPVNLQGEAEPLTLRKPKTNEDILPTMPANTRTVTGTSEGETMHTPVVIARDVGKGVGHSVKALVMLPLDMLTATTLGFRNAPRLYGDRTVRHPPQTVDGFRSGWVTAGQELWFGFYDGVTGTVRIPKLDVEHDGMAGLPKGVARGFGGLILKPIAGILSVPTYTTRGCVAWLRKQTRDTRKTERWLRRARMSEGAKDVAELKRQRAMDQAENGRHLRKGTDLEHVRTQALSRWTTRERQLVHEARQQERQAGSLIPARLKSRADGDHKAEVS